MHLELTHFAHAEVNGAEAQLPPVHLGDRHRHRRLDQDRDEQSVPHLQRGSNRHTDIRARAGAAKPISYDEVGGARQSASFSERSRYFPA